MQDWERVFAIFDQAINLPDGERPAFLEVACEDETLRQSVRELLAVHEEGTTFLDRPLIQRRGGGLSLELELPNNAQAPSDPETIGPYRILRRIGQGGMGSVFLAIRSDEAFQRRVAIKLVRPGMESEASLRRLRTERQILAGLDHPHIAKLFDGGTTASGLPYFVLEYVEGMAIDQYCEQNQLTLDERLILFCKICSAVQYAHQNLIVHRDIKPSNTLIRPDGEPKLLDFGIAKLLNPELSSSELEPTSTWHRMLTPNYASPEQIRGQPITTASDIYSLGVLLYKLLTGHLPRQFSGRSMPEIERLLSETEPVAPSVAVTRLPEDDSAWHDALKDDDERRELSFQDASRHLAGDLDAIILKALRSAPQQRYGSVDQMAHDIENYQRGLPVIARAGTWRYRGGKFLRRHRKAAVGVLAAVVLLIGFAAAMALQASRIAHERDQARQERDKKAQVLSFMLELFARSNPYVEEKGIDLTVREALERSVPVLDKHLHDQPEVRAEVLYASGSILRILGEHEAARSQLGEALATQEQLYGGAHPDTARTMSALASVYKEQGEKDEAERLARQAVDLARGMAEGLSPEDAREILSAPLNELVSVLCYYSEYGAAEELAVEAMRLVQGLPASEARITALEHLARIRSFQENYPESVALNREAVALRRAHFGERHPEQIATLNNLGVSLRRMEEFESARSIYREAIDLYRNAFDREDPYLLNNLASLMAGLEDFEAAETLYRQASTAAMEQFGERYWMVFAFDVQIAQMQARQGNLAEAATRLDDLIEGWKEDLQGVWRLDHARGVLGAMRSELGQCREAESLLISSFEKLLEQSREQHKRSALDRLREHVERCDSDVDPEVFAARLLPSAE